MAAAWVVEVRQRALEVEVRCVRAHRALANAMAYLAPPMIVADGQDARGRIQAVFSIVNSAYDDLRRAANATLDAEVVALHGAAADPMIPLPSIEHIPDGDHNARLVLGLFQCIMYRAVAARNSMERCCGHLHRLRYLLDYAPGFHGPDVFLEAQRALATTNLESARASSRVCAALAIVAKRLAR